MIQLIVQWHSPVLAPDGTRVMITEMLEYVEVWDSVKF